jgi:hypothetical protein
MARSIRRVGPIRRPAAGPGEVTEGSGPDGCCGRSPGQDGADAALASGNGADG